MLKVIAIAVSALAFAALIAATQYNDRDIPYDDALGNPSGCVDSPLDRPSIGDTLYFCRGSSDVVGRWHNKRRTYTVIKKDPAVVIGVREDVLFLRPL